MNVADNHGYIVHHKNYINVNNINDYNVTIDFNNLELLCIDCHNKEHFKTFDNDGNIIAQNKNIFDLIGVYDARKSKS